MRILLVFVSLLLFMGEVNAQFYNSGQEPTNIQWYQLFSPRFRVVFPRGMENLAQNYLTALEKMSNTPDFRYTSQARRLDVLLHTGTVSSNAWVAWAPARLEVLTTPPQDMYAHHWYNQLAAHELRHAIQITNIQTSTTRFMSSIFGQQATGLALGLHVPLWLMEGDAVWTESVFSKAGRLRDPWFLMPLKTQWEEGIDYSYDKAYFGSYKDFTPNNYALGSALVMSANRRFGRDAFFPVFTLAGKHFIWPGAFRHSLKKISGLTPDEFYKSSRESFIEKTNLTHSGPFENEIYGNKSGRTLVYLNQTYGKNPAFIIKTEKESYLISEAGFYLDTPIDIGTDHILFVRQVPHLRWQHRDRTEIVFIHPQTGQQRNFRISTRPVAPVLSPNGKRIAATETREDGLQEILLIDLEKETLIDKIPSPDPGFLTFPSWMNDETLLFITSGDAGYAITSYQIANKTWKQITPYTYHCIRNLKAYGDTLFFAGEFKEKGEIMAFVYHNNKTYRLTQSRFGADYPSLDKSINELVFSEYTPAGYKIKSLPLDNLLWEETPAYWDSNVIPFAEIPCMNIDSSPSHVDIQAKRYNGLLHLINIHSWGPVSISTEEETVKPGITFMSQNLLNTLTLRGGYEYEFDKNGGRVFAETEYAGFFPIFKASAYEGWYERQNATEKLIKTKEREATLQMLLPLNFSRGNFYRSMTFLTGVVLQDYKRTYTSSTNEYTKTIPRVDYAFLFSLRKITPFQNLFPKAGLVFRATVRTTPFKQHYYGQQYATESWIYLPGWGLLDGFRIYSGLEWNTEKAFASRIIRLPGGYTESEITLDKTLLSYGITYRLPLLYPDWSLPGVAYLKRIYGGLFFDKLSGNKNKAQSVGMELFGDFHIFRLPAPANVGVRYAYLVDENRFRVEIFGSFSFSF